MALAGYRIERRTGYLGRVSHVAVIELSADDCEATAEAFGPHDAMYREMYAAAAEIREADDE